VGDSNVPITAGSGTNIDTYQISGGDHQQIVRDARATAVTASYWTVTAEGQVNVIPVDASRIGLIIASAAFARVYLKFSQWIPSSADFDWYLDPGDRWELPIWLSTQTISMVGASAGGQVFWNLATAA
jgi:hypothetical protein